jgi:hypothetical protein
MRTLDAIGGNMGGATKLGGDPGKARNIHISILNPTNAAHLVAFGRSQRELAQPAPNGVGFPGFPVVAVPNTVVNQTVGGVAYSNFLMQGWVGELWAVADVSGIVQVEILDAGWPEK